MEIRKNNMILWIFHEIHDDILQDTYISIPSLFPPEKVLKSDIVPGKITFMPVASIPCTGHEDNRWQNAQNAE